MGRLEVLDGADAQLWYFIPGHHHLVIKAWVFRRGEAFLTFSQTYHIDLPCEQMRNCRFRAVPGDERRRPGAHWIELQCASGIFGFTAVAAHIAWVRDVPPDVLEESFFIRFPQSAGGDVTAAERG